MSEASLRIPCFSNPRIPSATPVGIPEGQPGAADNARWMTEQASRMRGSAHWGSLPVFIQQPQGIQVNEGQLLTLAVTVYNAASLQWYKDDQPIPGATANTYAKTAAAADTGNYKAIATNSIGSETSETCYVRANSTTPNPSNPGNTGNNNNNGGGGGGGGAPSLLYLTMLCSLLLARKISSRARPSLTPIPLN